ncbi:MAG TPA: GDP-mannose 4,6-dehydratase, partial [Elusimicrobiales bacterium]|nr:GDP-mannose 4,6-dehydratase [Elusimicrobiales bacterium]
MKRTQGPDLMSANILVTGGAGFIGSNFIEYAFGRPGFRGRIVNYDKLTYAGTPANLSGVARAYGSRYKFVKGDVRDYGKALRTLRTYRIDAVVH